jgi:hypothetical protein
MKSLGKSDAEIEKDLVSKDFRQKYYDTTTMRGRIDG